MPYWFPEFIMIKLWNISFNCSEILIFFYLIMFFTSINFCRNRTTPSEYAEFLLCSVFIYLLPYFCIYIYKIMPFKLYSNNVYAFLKIFEILDFYFYLNSVIFFPCGKLLDFYYFSIIKVQCIIM